MNRSQRARRRTRREASRRARTRAALPDDWFSYSRVFSVANLMASSRACLRGVRWKQSVAGFDKTRLLACVRINRALMSGVYKRKSPVCFTLLERGKLREISGPLFADRVVQRCLMDSFLLPVVVPTLTHSNTASIQGRGTSLARAIFERDMRRAAAASGPTSVYIVQWDVKGYFASVPSARALAVVSRLAIRIASTAAERGEATRLLRDASPAPIGERPS